MSQSLKIQQQTTGGRSNIRLQGQIDEDAKYTGVKFDQVTHVIFDFEGVTLINSTGLQKWVQFLTQVPKKIQIHFERCTPKIVKQIDMFPGFLANRSVEINSFFAPYYCEKCSKSENVLLHPNDLRQLDAAPEMKCKACQNLMEFDAIEKKYFQFLNRLNRAS